MKVLLPEGKKLKGFERQLQERLEKINLEGFALMGFSYQEVNSSKLHEVDAVVLLEPGIFVCLEAKGYTGEWTGSANEKWLCNGQEIKSNGGNPYDQVRTYSLVIKDKLKQDIFKNAELYVNPFIVVPDKAKISIQNAVIDRFEPVGTICICHCSELEEVLSSIYRPNKKVKEIVADLGLEQIIDKLSPKPPPPEPWPIRNTLPPIAAGVICTVGLLAGVGVTIQHFFGSNSCPVPTETRIDNTCYKDLTRAPLRIGILSAPDQYENFSSYLKEQLGSNALDVLIEGNADISYIEAQNKIAKQEWDIIFAFSPMNGMRAKDNGYTWIARMFPQLPSTYQSTLYVRANSPIRSLNDITTSTKIALGDFNSASSFYMPIYDLYGKSMNATAGHRSSKIKDLVAGGIVDMGAGVYSFIKDDPKFRIIHVSREIPGSGVYLSPKIAPKVQEQLQQILMNAPEEIREEANYGEGQEPGYEPFRAISLRADEVLGCADFDRQPVQFFCDNPNNQPVQQQPQEELIGTITGFTKAGNGMVRLRFEEKNSRICQLSISLKTLSSVPNGTSPGMINRKQVSLTNVQLEPDSNASCNIEITDPKQIIVF